MGCGLAAHEKHSDREQLGYIIPDVGSFNHSFNHILSVSSHGVISRRSKDMQDDAR